MRIAFKAQTLGAAAFIAAFLAAGPASAELQVIDSTVPGIAIDAKFSDNAVFDVPAGKKLKFLKTPANSTHEIAGPYKGTLDAYTSCGWIDWAQGKCARPGSDQPGATRSAPVMGGTRSLRPAPVAPAAPGN